MMDIVQTNKSRNKGKLLRVTAALFLLGAGLAFWFSTGNASYLASKSNVLIDSVQRGTLNISVRGTGVMVPEDIRWIATNVSGRVERIIKKAGASVKQGDVLLEMSNPQLQQELLEAQWELQALEAQTRARKVSLESELLDQEITVLSEKLNHERALLTLNAQEKLLSQGIVAISRIDYEEVRIDVDQFKQLWLLEKKRLEKRRENLTAHVVAGEARLNSMRKRVQRIEQQVIDLNVVATMDSIVQDVSVELGQQVSQGTNLAMLARSDRFIAELRVPEKQIKDVALGQKVLLDTRISKIEGRVLRIDPAVINSSVQVDVELTGDVPREVRPELTVDGVIEITTIEDALYVKRPMYASSFSHAQVYLVDEEGELAVKRPLKYGHMSTQFIEIEEGLAAGDSIVISDTSAWEKHAQVRLN